jgi:uncharacterized protein YecE (DUF72 family)
MIRIGPAGWSYQDWDGIVYPPKPPKGFHGATYIAEFSDAIEVNSSFYRPPTAANVRGWVWGFPAKLNACSEEKPSGIPG